MDKPKIIIPEEIIYIKPKNIDKPKIIHDEIISEEMISIIPKNMDKIKIIPQEIISNKPKKYG